MDHREQSVVLVIFGITGDLAQRKLLPALYRLVQSDQMPRHFRIIGITRRTVERDAVYARLQEFSADPSFDAAIQRILVEHTEMLQMALTESSAYRQLYRRLKEIEDSMSSPIVRLYYLAIPPQIFAPIVRLLGETGHAAPLPGVEDSSRLLVEKPFGYDMTSARELIGILDKSFAEHQIYRIDHYLARETAQNILTFRFGNSLFESAWDNRSIAGITVAARETIGVEGRGQFYEDVGALRDIIQSHLLHLLAITTMAEPARLASDEIHAEKLKLFGSIRSIPANRVDQLAQRGQYIGYRKEVGNPKSRTETFARVRLEIDNEQWRGVPIVLETGKALAEKLTEIVVRFARRGDLQTRENRLIFRIQPDEAITVYLHVKHPGLDSRTEMTAMGFQYKDAFKLRHPEPYERVLTDAMKGDRTLFAAAFEVIESWRIVQNVVEEWAKSGATLEYYERGSHGPTDPEIVENQ